MNFLRNEETDNCKRDIPELILSNEQIIWYGTSYVVPIVLYNAKTVNHSSTHCLKSEKPKEEWKLKIHPIFIFE